MTSPGPFDPSYGVRRRRSGWSVATWGSLGFVAMLWLLEAVDVALDNRLDAEGIRPGSLDGLSGVVLAPLLHLGWGHLAGNTVPLLVLGFLLLLSGVGQWVAVTACVWVVGGLGTWFFGGLGSIHLGASILVFGWLAYLLVRGVFTRRASHVVVGLLVLVLYGGALWGVLPGQPGVSWQGHLFGALGGVLAAWWLRPRRPALSQW